MGKGPWIIFVLLIAVIMAWVVTLMRMIGA